jgi:sphingomyelin phosphodiesterase
MLFCVSSLGVCPHPDVEDHEVTFPTPKPDTRRPEPSGLEPLRVVHFSDIHIDPFYQEGTNANCTKPICCRYVLISRSIIETREGD